MKCLYSFNETAGQLLAKVAVRSGEICIFFAIRLLVNYSTESMIFAGLPSTMMPRDTSYVTTLPPATIKPSPMTYILTVLLVCITPMVQGCRRATLLKLMVYLYILGQL